MSHDRQTADEAVSAALAVLEEPLPRPGAFVSYDVRGCLLLVGPSTPVLEIAGALRNQFDVVAVVDGPTPRTRLLGVSIVSARRVTLAGYLGRFSAVAEDGDGQPVDLAVKSTNDDGYFDLVMDLSPTPIIDRSILPLGYLRPSEPGQYDAALGSLPALRGEIRKPRYVNFQPARCVHRRQQVVGCDRCVDVCPAAAISTDQQAVQVEAHLCRGCGTCAAVCPSGALTYADPTLDDIVERLERGLQAFRSAGGINPWIGFYVDDCAAMTGWATAQSVTLLPFAVHAVSSVGLETWLAALGLGAAGVVLWVAESTPPVAVNALTRQLELAGKILEELGQPRGRVRMLRDDRAETEVVTTVQAGDPHPEQAWSYPRANPDPRARLLAVFDRLWSGSHQRSGAGGVELPAWATFGAVEVDSNTCTLCLACRSLCPTGALWADRAGAELRFTEAACVQCGLCERGCPENAVKRRPRFDYQALQGKRTVTLNRATMANCTQCGRPFMSAALLASALKHLTGDGSAIGQARRTLNVCPRCRANNALQAQFPSVPRAPK